MSSARIDQRYEVIREVGAGGFGKVYLVKDQKIGKQVALKTLTPPAEAKGYHDFFLQTFQNEFEVLTKFQHPHLCAVYEYGYDEERKEYYFTSEWVEGKSLIEACESLPYEACEALFVQACRGLEYIHANGFVHHDIKPANILVIDYGPKTIDQRLQVKIIDFGLAQLKSKVRSVTAGTKKYMAPEMLVEGYPADHRSDLYALGLVFREVFERLKEKWPPYLAPILAQLTAKDPSERFFHANSVIRAINLQGEDEYTLETQETLESYAHTSELIGRDTILSSLKEWVEAPKGKFSMGLLGGQGLGKSRLLKEMRTFAQLKQIPFQEVSKSGGLWESVLTGLQKKNFFDPEALIETAVGLLLGEKERKLWLIDDLHHLESVSQKIVVRAMQENRGSALFLWTFNPQTADKTILSQWLGAHLELTPFSDPEISQYLESFFGISDVSDSVVKKIRKMTSGNPYFLEELVRGWIRQGVVVTREKKSWPVDAIAGTESLETHIKKAFDQLEGDAKTVFEILVIHGRRLDADALSAVTGFSKTSLVKALQELKRQGMAETLNEEHWEVANTMLRDTIYQALSREKKQGLHKVLFAYLKNHKGSLGDLAHHASLGGVAEGIGMVMEAAKQAESRFAYDQALRWYERLKPTTEICLKKAGLYQRLGNDQKAKELYEQVLADSNDKRNLEKAYALRGVGWLAQKEGRLEEGLRCFEESLTLLESFHSDYQMVVLNDIGHHHLASHQWKEAAGAFAKSAALLEANPNLEYAKNNHLALAYLKLGKKAEALAFAQKKLQWATDQKNDPMISLCHTELGQLHWELGDFSKAKKCYEKALVLAEKLRSPQNTVKILRDLLSIAQSESHYGDSIQYLEKLMDQAKGMDSPRTMADYYLVAGNLYTAIGLFTKAKKYLDQAEEVFGANGWIFLSRGCLAEGLSQADMAHKWFRNALKEGEKTKDALLVIYAHFAACELAIKQGERREAEKCFDGGQKMLSQSNDPELAYRSQLLGVRLGRGSDMGPLLADTNLEHVFEVRDVLVRWALERSDPMSADWYLEGKRAIRQMRASLPEAYQQTFLLQPRFQDFLKLVQGDEDSLTEALVEAEPPLAGSSDETKPLSRR